MCFIRQRYKTFVKYIKKYKEDAMKYHVMKGAARAPELSDNMDNFTIIR